MRQQDTHTRLWQRLTRPAETVKGDSSRQRAHLLAVLLLPVIIFGTLGSFIMPDPAERQALHVLIPVLALAWIASHGRYFNAAGLIAALAILTVPYYLLLLQPIFNEAIVVRWLSWTSVAIILSSMWLPVRLVFILWFVNIVFMLALPVAVPALAYMHMITIVFQSTIIGSLILLAARIRNRTFRILNNQTRELNLAKEEAEHAARIQSQFLANMSHEIRTPMNGVLGTLDLLKRTRLDERQQNYARIAHHSAETLLSLLNDILDFSKMESGKLVLESISMDIPSLVEEVALLFSEQAERKGLELVCYTSPAVAANHLGDPTRLRQILMNLVSNAIKFTTFGEILVRLEVGDAVKGSQQLLFEIRDTGIGIKPEIIPRLFSAFIQKDGSTTRRYGGTGLGLAISQQLVQHMGGAISVTSEPGAGSSFQFSLLLPVASSKEARPLPEARHVLVVDDNATNRMIACEYLAAWQVANEATGEPSEVLGRLQDAAHRGKAFDTVLLDMSMPDLDGISIARDIRQSALAPIPRIILLSSMGDDLDQSDRLLFDFIMHKPLRQSALFNALNLATARRAQRNSSEEQHTHYFDHKIKVLLAEDNEVNRMVSTEMLNLLGITTDTAANGEEAFVRFRAHHYDLILMDCQMPVMDGYAATRAIRQYELTESRPHTPILALTAHAMAGDREKCLDAGMDDYMTKPITYEILVTYLERWLADKTELSAPHLPAHDAQAGPESLRKLMGAQFGEFVKTYGLNCEKHIAALRQAMADQDNGAVALSAHSIKGSSGFVHAYALMSQAETVEMAARNNSLHPEAVETLIAQMILVRDELAALNDSP